MRRNSRSCKIHAGKIDIVLIRAEVYALQRRGVERFVGLIGQGQVDCILMQTGQHELIQFLPLCLVGRGQDICDSLIDLCLIRQALLRRIVAVDRCTHGSE